MAASEGAVERDFMGRRLAFACEECTCRWSQGAFDEDLGAPLRVRYCPFCGSKGPERLPKPDSSDLATVESLLESVRRDVLALREGEENARSSGELGFVLDGLDDAREHLVAYQDGETA